MTLANLYQRLSDFLDTAHNAEIFTDPVRELEILVTKLRIRLLSGAYEPQKTITCGNRHDLEKLLQAAELMGRTPALEDELCKSIKEIVIHTTTLLKVEGMHL